MTCPKCNKVRRVCEADGCVTEETHSNSEDVTMQDSDEKVVEDATYLLDEYPARQYFSVRKIKLGDLRCKCGWYHSDGYMCPKAGEDNPQLKPESSTEVSTVAKNAIVDDKCRGFILKREDGMRFTVGYGADGWIDTKEIERIAEGQNVYFLGHKEQSK